MLTAGRHSSAIWTLQPKVSLRSTVVNALCDTLASHLGGRSRREGVQSFWSTFSQAGVALILQDQLLYQSPESVQAAQGCEID